MINKLKNDIFKIMIEIFIFNKKRRMKIKSRWAKKHLQKYVDIGLKDLPYKSTEKQECNIIWQYWHQGEKNAPLLIQKCFDSVKKYHPERKQVILDFDSIQDYIEIPSRYYDLVNQGKMKLAFFSDILRTYLLSKYGGTWIDSTIFLTGRIPNDILESEFFVFSKNPEEDWLENKMSNFFIHSLGNSKSIEVIKSALNHYWNENDFVINYFMYEHMMTLLSESTESIKQEWNNMPFYNAEDTGILQKRLFDNYTPEGFEQIKSKTSIHKLSYKILKENTSGKSYYDFIVSI